MVTYTQLLWVVVLALVANGFAVSQRVEAQGTLILYAPDKSASHVSALSYPEGKKLYQLNVGTGPHEAASSPDKKMVVISDYGKEEPGHTISLIDVALAKVEKTITLKEYGRPHGLAFLPDAKGILVTTEAPDALLMVDLEQGTIVKAMPTVQKKSHMVALSPDATLAFVANVESGSVSVVDLNRWELVKTIATAEGAEGIAVVPGSKEVWVTNRASGSVSIIDIPTLRVVKTLPVPGFPIRAAHVASQNVVLVTAAHSALLYVFDVKTRAVLHKIAMPGLSTLKVDTEGRLFGDRFVRSSAPIGILLTPDESAALIANSYADVISVVSLVTWKVDRLIPVAREPDGMAWGLR